MHYPICFFQVRTRGALSSEPLETLADTVLRIVPSQDSRPPPEMPEKLSA